MRKKRAIKNILFSFALEVVTVLSNLIVPKLILQSFGSDVNGLINSISTFIGYVSLLQLGVGSVIKAALYRPLAEKDTNKVSIVVKTTESFFFKIGCISIGYILILSVLFPILITDEFDLVYTGSLVIIIGLATVAQYMFGITYEMLLESDQKSFVFSTIQIFSVSVNTILCAILIINGASIHFVKLVSAIVFIIKPIILNIYVKKKYEIDKSVKPDRQIIAQRWDGFAQGLAYFIHSKTDVFVLTLLSSLKDVSIYSVYALVTAGLSSVVNCIDKAVRSAIGNILAKAEKDNLKTSFDAYHNLIHMFSSICFSTAVVSVAEFVSVYVKNVNDANYVQPIFATLILTAELFYCLRMPYNSVIFAAGRFKETKKSAFIEAIINICISIALVIPFGLIGVAIGTLVAMIYRSIYFINYLHSNILMLDYSSQVKRFLTTLLSYVTSIVLLGLIPFTVNGFVSWALYSLLLAVLASVIVVGINLLFLQEQTIAAFTKFLKHG